jgi:two-component system nitrogen regulation sensor histidine kinase NtrY
MRFTRKHIAIAFIISLLGLLFSGLYFSQESNKEKEIEADLSLFGKTLQQQQSLLQEEVNTLQKFTDSTSYENITRKNLYYYSSLHENHGISLYVYEDSVLKFWSNNSDPIEKTGESKGFIKIPGGFYEKFTLRKNGKLFVGLLLIKQEHHFENSYVKNHFQKKFNLPETWTIRISPEKERFESLSGNTLSVIPDNDFSGTENEPEFLILEIICLLLFVIALFKSIQGLTLQYWVKILVFTGSMYLLRSVMVNLHFPFYLYESEIMDPQLFAYSSWFPSLGDLLMNGFSILSIAYFISKFPLAEEKIKALSAKGKYALIFVLFTLLFWGSCLVIELIEILVFNSNVVLDAKKILKINAFSGASILGILLFLYAFILLIKKAALVFKFSGISWIKIAGFLSSFFGVVLLFYFFI